MLRLFGIVLALIAVVFTMPASAMNFQVIRGNSGQRIVLATGLIVPGDAPRAAAALNAASRGSNGTKQLLLNSPGGSVEEALAMADVMDRVGVSTVVPARAMCGSACASILFVSGKYRRIESGGYLAIHSCYDIANGKQVDLCNAVISAHAQHEGVSGSAMMAFQEVAGANGAVVFDAGRAACFGLTRPAGKLGSSCRATTRGHRGR